MRNEELGIPTHPPRFALHRRRNEERFAAETTPVPLLTLFALEALLDLEALNSNNVRGGTCLAEAGGAKKSGWGKTHNSKLNTREQIQYFGNMSE